MFVLVVSRLFKSVGEELNADGDIEQFALNEASLVIVKFLQRYDKIEALDMGPIIKGLALTLSPGEGVKVRMHRSAT